MSDSKIRAFDVVPYLKTGTIVVGVNFRSVLLVTQDHELVNMHNGRKDTVYNWYTANSIVEIFEDFEDWEQADMPMTIETDEENPYQEIGPQGEMPSKGGRFYENPHKHIKGA